MKSSKTDYEWLLDAHQKMAILTSRNPIYAPIFERLERHLEAARQELEGDDPVARARAIVALQKAIA